MKPTISNSIGSSETYYTAQLRPTTGTIKFQVPTTYVNRSYGCMFTVAVGKQQGLLDLLVAYYQTCTDLTTSLHADSNEKYIKCRIRVLPDNLKIRVQVNMPEHINRPYGLVFDVYQIGLYKSLKNHIRAWCRKSYQNVSDFL